MNIFELNIPQEYILYHFKNVSDQTPMKKICYETYTLMTW